MQSLFFLVSLLAFGTQVVLADNGGSFKINIDTVRQCEPVFLNFTGSKPRSDGDISQVQVVPVNGTAMSIPVPSVNVTDQGIQLSFIPLPTDSNFVVSLENSNGDNVSKISDLFRVQSSTNSSCLNTTTPQKLFTLVNEPRQCEVFTVQYDATKTSRPSIRYYRPQDSSNPVILNSDDGQGTATYLLKDIKRGNQLVLLFQGGSNNGTMETSALLTVNGDASSSTDCINSGGNGSSSSKNDDDKNKGGLNQKTIIGLAIGGSIVALIACVMVAYLIWERRNRRRVSIHFDPSLLEKRSLPPSAPQSEVSTPRPQTVVYNQPYNGYIQNPPYTAGTSFERSTSPEVVTNRGNSGVPVVRHMPASSLASFQDIEGILNSQEQRVRDGLTESPLPSPTASEMKSPGAPSFAVRAQATRGLLTRADSATLSRQPSQQSSVNVDPYSGLNRASSGLLQPPLPTGASRSHFSAMTTSSFGGGFDTADRISGVPDSVSSPTSADLPVRRPLPAVTSNGLGRGNGERL